MSIEREFREILDSECSRDAVVEYLASHPKLLPVWFPRDSRIYSNLHLFGNEIADFAYHRDDTPGELWRFFRIASPNARLLDGAAPSPELLNELNNLVVWNAWFHTNLENESHVKPIKCAEFVAYDPEIYLVIGRRAEIESFQNHDKFEDWSFARSQQCDNIRPVTFDNLFVALSDNTWRKHETIEMVSFVNGETNVIDTFPNAS